MAATLCMLPRMLSRLFLRMFCDPCMTAMRAATHENLLLPRMRRLLGEGLGGASQGKVDR